MSVGPASVDLRLALPVAVAWGVLGILLGVPGGPSVGAAVFGAAAVALIIAAALRRRSEPRPGRHPRRHAGRRAGRWLPLLALACAASAVLLASAAATADGRRPQALLDAAGQGRFVTVDAVLTEAVREGDGRVAATLQHATIGRDRIDGPLPLVVFGALDRAGAGIGAGISVSGTLSATGPADAAAFLLFARGPVHVDTEPGGILAAADGLRGSFLSLAEGLPGDGGGLLPGLAIGDTRGVGVDLDAAMKRSSLSHLTAVSGANCAVVVALVLAAGAQLRIPLRWRIAAAVVVLAGFVVLVTPEPSVLRAAVMAAAVLFARSGGRGAGGLPVLALAVMVLLAIDPWLARSFGFVLSVLATAGLLVLSGPLARVIARVLPMPIAAVIAVPLAAQLACQPVIVLLSPTIPLFGVVANILAGPAAPIATVLGLVACLLAPLLPPAAGAVAQLAWLPASWIAAVATFFGDIPGGQLAWLEGAAGLALAATLTVLGVTAVLASPGRLRRAAALACAVLAVVSLGAAGGDQLRRRLAPPGDWAIAVCDVGQGDAVLVRSGGQVALIDTGPDPARLGECLDLLGVRRIDLLVLTHYDLDHVGGTAAVVGRVGRVLVGPADTPDDERLVAELAAGGAVPIPTVRGHTGRLGELRWLALWPPQRRAGIEAGNDSSVALSFAGVGECGGGCLTSVFLGDLGEQSQARLLGLNRPQLAALGAVDVVKVSHHGSADQSAALYGALGATLGLIGVGAGNTYGHPADSILATLESAGTAVARTDRDGMVLVSSASGGGVRVWASGGGASAAGGGE